jgi:AbiV family abortive infection protein
MAREELGRFNLLFDRRHELSDDGIVDAKELTMSLQPHKLKLQAGQTFVAVPLAPDRLAAREAAILQNDVSTMATISAELQKKARELKPHQAADLHQRRLKAQYVDFDLENERWSRPSDVSMADASALIRTVLAEICNAILSSQGVIWLHSAFESIGERTLPQIGPITQRVYQHLGNGDA